MLTFKNTGRIFGRIPGWLPYAKPKKKRREGLAEKYARLRALAIEADVPLKRLQKNRKKIIQGTDGKELIIFRV